MKTPIIIPDKLDDILMQRREAGLMASYIQHQTRLPYWMLARQCEYEARLESRVQRNRRLN